MKSQLSTTHGTIAVSDSGSGNPLVLLHGFLENMDMWEELVAPLQAQHRIIRIDLPGHGASPVVAETHTMELMADMVMQALEQLGVQRFALAGHSMGGYVSLALAEAHPEAVAGLCMMHSTATADSEEKKANRLRAIAAVEDNHVAFVKEAIPNLFAPANVARFPKAIARLQEVAAQTPAQGIAAALRGMRERPDRQDVVKGFACPVLWIVGRRDPAVPYALMPNQLSLARDSAALVLESTGHMGFVEAPVDVRFALEGFLEDVFA